MRGPHLPRLVGRAQELHVVVHGRVQYDPAALDLAEDQKGLPAGLRTLDHHQPQRHLAPLVVRLVLDVILGLGLEQVLVLRVFRLLLDPASNEMWIALELYAA